MTDSDTRTVPPYRYQRSEPPASSRLLSWTLPVQVNPFNWVPFRVCLRAGVLDQRISARCAGTPRRLLFCWTACHASHPTLPQRTPLRVTTLHELAISSLPSTPCAWRACPPPPLRLATPHPTPRLPIARPSPGCALRDYNPATDPTSATTFPYHAYPSNHTFHTPRHTTGFESGTVHVLRIRSYRHYLRYYGPAARATFLPGSGFHRRCLPGVPPGHPLTLHTSLPVSRGSFTTYYHTVAPLPAPLPTSWQQDQHGDIPGHTGILV